MKSIRQRLVGLFKDSEFIRYLVIGILTTLVNILITIIGNRFFGLEWRYLTNKIAYISAILFSYLANRIYVFRSKGKILPELFSFFISRFLISFIFEDAGYYLLYDILAFKATLPLLKDLPWAKVIGMVFVVLANYIVGKFLVFKGKEDELS